MPLLGDDIEEGLPRFPDNELLIEKVKVNELLDEPPKNVIEFDDIVFVALISPTELPAISCVTGDMIRKELEGFVSLELDCIMVAELMSLLLDEEALL